MPLESLEQQTGADPVAAIIVLHGLGADGNDFVPIARELDLSAIGPVRFVFPHAPIRPITINGGRPMRAWYDILGAELVHPAGPDAGADRKNMREDEAGLRASQRAVQDLLDREAARGIAPAHTVLMGFSQGCAMALLSGLRAPQRLAGVAGLSGYLPLAAHTAAERSPANRDVPLFLAHGRFDPVVPMVLGRTSRAALDALGYAVQWHEYPMEHSVCAEEIGDLNRWLVQVLAPAATARRTGQPS